MKNWVKILLTLIGIGVIAAILVYIFVYNKPHPDYEKKKAEITITAEELFNDYKNDKETADQKYNGKLIQISGEVSKIDEADTLVVVVFVFEEGMFGDEGIRCTMLPNHEEKAKTLTSGNEISIKGFCNGYNETDVIFTKSSIVEE